MSMQARVQLCERLVFTAPTQRTDLLDFNLTNTDLIALLQTATDHGEVLGITAVRTDHSDDSALGFYCHAHGFCADLWPMNSRTPGDWMDANDPRFAQWLQRVAASLYLHQIGLAGTAWTQANVDAAGPTVFHDDGADHVHLSADGG